MTAKIQGVLANGMESWTTTPFKLRQSLVLEGGYLSCPWNINTNATNSKGVTGDTPSLPTPFGRTMVADPGTSLATALHCAAILGGRHCATESAKLRGPILTMRYHSFRMPTNLYARSSC